jgi:imidazolonepropionase-like amidohydrolase
MAEHGIFLVPTLYAISYAVEISESPRREIWLRVQDTQTRTFRKALAKHVRVVFGTDAGAFEWTINPAKEFGKLVEYGMTPREAIQSATINAAELLGMKDQIGVIEPGKFADIIAVAGDPLNDIKLLEQVNFVMKEGAVYKAPNGVH